MQTHIFALLNSAVQPGLQEIEVSSSFQIPGFVVVGLASQEISEAKERVRSAIDASGFSFPKRRLVLNLSPANIRKRGTGADLAMALSVLNSESLSESKIPPIRVLAQGELGLDGNLKSTGQTTRLLWAALQCEVDLMIIPDQDLSAMLSSLKLMGPLLDPEKKSLPKIALAGNLREAWTALEQGHSQASLSDFWEKHALSQLPVSGNPDPRLLPLGPSLERIVGMAAAGSHHLMLVGPKGTGKTHALEWLCKLLPEAPPSIRIENRLINELSESPTPPNDVPARWIGTHAKPAALIGSSVSGCIVPGEFSRAHGGILIADEFPEWSRDARECLREPLERGRVTLTRARKTEILPSRFLFAANGNLCPCGGWPTELPMGPEMQGAGFTPKPCRCRAHERDGYLARLSGPVLDRVDAIAQVVEAPRPASETTRPSELLEVARARVERVHLELQHGWGAPPGTLDGYQLEAILGDYPGWRKNLDQCGMASLRSRHKTLRLALTLSAWDGIPQPKPSHFWEAAQLRPEKLALLM